MGYSVFPAPSSGLSASELITSPTWTEIANTSGSGVASISFTSLSGYRRYKIWWEDFLPSVNGESISLRINNDSNSNYLWFGTITRNGSTPQTIWTNNYASFISLGGFGGNNTAYSGSGWVEINNANSTSLKDLNHYASGLNSSGTGCVSQLYSIYTGTSAISSLQILTDGGGNMYINNIRLYGGN